MFSANAYRIRFATADDADTLRRLAERGSQEPLVGRVLIGHPGPSRSSCHERSARGSPKDGNTLLSPNHVIAERRSPSRVSTMSPYGRAIAARSSGR
jgi:hypothetical protein